jgi:hypothetical protein
MNRATIFVLSALTVTASNFSMAEQDPSEVLRAIGIKEGLPCAKVKASLVARGWRPDMSEAESRPPYKQHPEISCGSGADAICSAGFIKGREQIAIMVGEAKSGLFSQALTEQVAATALTTRSRPTPAARP